MATKLKSTTDVQTQEQHDLEIAVAGFAQKSAALTQGKVALSNDLITTRDKHQSELTQLQPERDNALTEVQRIAETNRKKLFNRQKSVRTSFGVVGFRKKRMQFKLASGETTESVLQKLRTIRPDLVTTKEVISKNRLYAARNSPDFRSTMAQCGIQIVEEENFYVKLNN